MLSRHELHVLQQIERSLSAEDPKLASTLLGHTLQRRARIIMGLAGMVFAAGILLLIAGVTSHWAVGVLGFVVMLGSASFAANLMQEHGSPGNLGSRAVGRSRGLLGPRE